jgi:MoaA/NifB/PqqE/SkfB family radical SAM enzyme
LTYLERIIQAGVTDFGISLHGHLAAIHDSISGCPGSFNQTIRAIENLGLTYGTNPPLAVNCVITPANQRHLAAIAELLINYNVSTIKFAFLHGIGRAKSMLKPGQWPRMSDVRTDVIDALRLIERIGKPTTTAAIEGIPPCLLRRYEVYCSDTSIYPVLIINEHGSVEEFHIRSERAKREKCSSCAFDPVCLGPWKEYPEEFGWSEFVPVTDFAVSSCFPAMKGTRSL